MNKSQEVISLPASDVGLNNTRIVSVTPLRSPTSLKKELPLTSTAASTVTTGREEIESIIRGEDNRLLMMVGPCSIHDPDSALEYARRLAVLREQYQEKLCIIMRVYFEKPRTNIGWTGLISSPDPFGEPDIDLGRYLARKILLEVNELGLPVATEFLDPLNPPFYSDLISWGAIGARTTESQTHRHMASGLSCPVGFKNGTGGSGDIAINAMLAAKSPHTFVGIDDDGVQSSLRSAGNPYTQLILRGGSNGPNFDFGTVVRASMQLQTHDLPSGVLVDCSHANAGKDFRRQAVVLDSVLDLRERFKEYTVSGVMIESHLNEGRQDLVEGKKLQYGVSITDGCVGWEETERMLADAYLRA